MQRIDSVQILRGVAALCIAFGHLDNYAGIHNISKSVSWIGIDLFFVISGFVIAYTALPQNGAPANVKQFMFKRLVRIYPTYWMVCLLALFAALWTGYRADLSTWNYIASVMLFPQRIAEQFIPVAWSLHLEFLFYAIVALILLICPRHFWKAVVVWFLALVVGQFFVTIAPSPTYNWGMYFTSMYQFEFLCGLLVGYALLNHERLRVPPKPVLIAIACAGVALAVVGLAYGIFTIDAKQKFGDYTIFRERCVLLGIAFAMVIYGIAMLEAKGHLRVQSASLMLRIGNASYVLYLIHDILFICFGHALEQAFGLTIREHPPYAYLLFMPMAALLCIAISVQFSERIERPVIQALRRRYGAA